MVVSLGNVAMGQWLMHLNYLQTLCTLLLLGHSEHLLPTGVSFIRPISGIMILRPSPSAINSASVVLKVISVCILEYKVIVHPAYLTTYPDLDFAVVLYMCAVSALQLPLKSASHHNSSE